MTFEIILMLKKVFIYIFCFLTFIYPVFAVNFPNPSGFVNDFAGLYSTQFKNNLEDNLTNFEKSTKSEIAVLTINSLEGMDIETYAVKLFEKWKIGKKGSDNGLLLLISKNDRKMRIEVGYGLEQYVTDGRSGDIIRTLMAPEFKKGDYEKGTFLAVEQIKNYIGNKDIAPKVTVQKDNPASNFLGFIILGVFYVGATYIASFLGRTKEIWPGGALGAVLGGIGGLLVLSVLGLIFGAILFGGLGLLLDYILTKNFQYRKTKNLPTGFWNTWGGFGGGGGSSSGGGFGGFGGGSSGGGGASGGW